MCNSGLNIPVGLESSASASANPTINNNIILGDSANVSKDNLLKPSVLVEPIQTRDVSLTRVEDILYEIYAKILLNSNKELIANLISKNHIILTKKNLEYVIATITGQECEIIIPDVENGCCVAKYSPIRRIEQIKIKDTNGVITDFKQTMNAQYNELKDKYHICLKFVYDA